MYFLREQFLKCVFERAIFQLGLKSDPDSCISHYLLQLQIAIKVYCKMRQIFCYKCVDFITTKDRYHKMRQLLHNVLV